MKTTVSIPDDLFRAAEATARRMRMSRSQLFAEALRLFREAHCDRGVTERLDEVFGARGSNPDPALMRWQAQAMREDW